MAITDLDQLQEVQLQLQEDATFSNGIWTLAEVIAYFNERQFRFLFDTGVIASTIVLGWTAGEAQMPLPPDWIDTLAARWHDFATGLWTPLPSSDFFEMDHLESPESAVTSQFPQAYRDGDTIDTQTIGLTPAPLSAGEVELVYVALSEILDGTGQLFDIPDDWVPYIKYGTLADMLKKEGRGKDLLRARYCEQRYTEGVVLAKALLDGRP